MRLSIIIAIAFVLLIPLAVFAQLIPEHTPELAEPESSLSFQSVECPPGSFEKLFSGEVMVCINEATGKALKPGELNCGRYWICNSQEKKFVKLDSKHFLCLTLKTNHTKLTD